MAETIGENGAAAGAMTLTPDNGKTPVALGAHGVTVRSLEELWRFSQVIAASDLAPKDYYKKPANVAVALEMGMELGLRPMQAIQSIAVINGRPSIYGDAMLALVQSSGLLDDIEEYVEGEGDSMTAVCITKRRGRSKPHRTEFSVADAKAAKLWDKDGPWKQYRRRMLQFRARGFNLRDVFPDVLRGMIAFEEARDAEAIDITPRSETATDQPMAAAKPATRSAGLAARVNSNKMPTPAAPEPAAEEMPTAEIVDEATGEIGATSADAGGAGLFD